jgi:FKBP-type peptidyl-prolyl cis-trans isomerase FkpA
MKISGSILIALLFIMFPFCSGKQEKYNIEKEVHETEKALVEVNRLMVKKDKEKIIEYIRLHHLDMKETPTGLWYEIYRKGSGEKAQSNKLATISYHVYLLNGTFCYSSDSLGLKQFRIGQGGVESGLEEGVLLLREGDKAKFIMPPHLAHGLPGDGNKIPARSIIVYDIELLKVES